MLFQIFERNYRGFDSLTINYQNSMMFNMRTMSSYIHLGGIIHYRHILIAFSVSSEIQITSVFIQIL